MIFRCKIKKDASAPPASSSPLAKTLYLIFKSALSSSSSIATAPLRLLFIRAIFVCVRLCLCVSGLIISDRDVMGEWQSFIRHNWRLHPITLSAPFFFFFLSFFSVTNQVPASVVFPGGYTAVDWEFRGFRQGHSSAGRWRQWRGLRRSGGERSGRRRRGKKRNTDLLLGVFEVFSRHAVSFWGQEGGVIVLTGFICRLKVKGREKEPRSNGENLRCRKAP